MENNHFDAKKPNFFIVGAPKSGTTSLWYYLKQHPEIFMCEPKEPHFFCKDLIQESIKFHGYNKFNYITKLEDYLKLFHDVKASLIIGEASTGYLFSKVAAREIYKFNPNSKILISIREPVDFMYSDFLQLLYMGDEVVTDFKLALILENKRKRWEEVPTSAHYPSILYYKEKAKFYEQIKRYLSVFPRENVKIILLDDLKRNPRKVYREILEFLKVKNKDFEPDFTLKNKAKIYRVKLIRDVLHNPDKWGLIKKVLRKILPSRAYVKLYQFLKKINTVTYNKPPLDKNLKLELMKEFKSEVKKLSSLIGRDLEKIWGYDKI